MSKQTGILVPPTLDEVKAQASKIRLPWREAERFFFYYSSNGWRVGKNPMKCWVSALSGWRLRWQMSEDEKRGTGLLKQTESALDRTLKEIKEGKL